MRFDGFFGNEALQQRLSASFAAGKVSHCYLIAGPVGSGKRTLATILAAAMQCTGGGDVPCRACTACRKVFSGTHPDVITVDEPEKKTVSVDLVREARADAFIRPNEGRRKIYILPRAQDFGPAAQNALLKLLEEPPQYAAFLLLATNPGALLPTIRSRAVQLSLCAVPREAAMQVLRAKFPDRDEATLRAAYDASGGFLGSLHPSLTATYQALQALCAVQRAQSGQAELYDLTDVTLTAQPELASGVKAAQLQKNGAVFSDTEAHENRDAISILGSFGIISGVGGGRFSPDSTMTRAQFAKIVVCALGLEAQYRGTFADVAESAWYAPYVDTAAAYGIVRGVGDGNFNPDSSITRQESAVMLARAAALCGFDTAVEDVSAVPDTVSDWAGSGVAFCLKNEIMTTAQAQQSGVAVLRCEVAQMLCNLLMQTAILKF